MNKQEQLLTILYDLSQVIGSEMELLPLLKKVLQRLMFHTGYSCGLVFSNEPLSDGSTHQCLQVAIGDHLAQKHLGEYLDLSSLSEVDNRQQADPQDLTMLPIRQNYYQVLLKLPVPDYGLILLLGVEAGDQTQPFEQLFAPLLANLAKTIRLCQHSEAYTSGLIADRDRVNSDNERFRQAMDTSSDFMFLINPESRQIIDCNQSAVIASGYMREEMLEMPLDDLLVEYTSAFVSDLVRRIESSHKGAISEASFRCKNGNRFPVETRFSLLQQKNELAVLIAVVSDITERNVAAAELFHAKQLAETTLNSIGDAVITTDDGGLVTGMNSVAEQLTGWSFDEAQGKPVITIFPIIDASTRQSIESPIEKVLTTGEIAHLGNHTTLISRDGAEYQIADSTAPIRNGEGNILGIVLVFNDISEQYQLRQAAAKNKRDLQAIMDHSPAVIYVKDVAGHFIFINRQFEKLFHIQRDEIVGKSLYDVFPKDIANEMRHNDKAVLEAGHALESEEVAPHDDGLHTYLSVKFPLFDEGGSAYAVCGISTDITVRKQQEKQLRRSQKMDALGKLTGGIAHDYNNMLGVVLGYAELLERRLSAQPKLAKYAQQIHHACNRSIKLTQKLLAFSRKGASNSTIVNINMLLQDQQHMLEKILTPRIELVFDLAEGLWPVWIDGSDLEDAILNMSINAMHAMEAHGQLTIQTRNETVSEIDARILHVDMGHYVLFSMTDTGCGMDKSIKERIFEPFFSTKGDKGTGLGLSQVHGFVERSHGAIKVYSEPGYGTRFVLYFPRHHESGCDDQLEEDSSAVNVTGSETILVVDDESALLDLSSEILRQQGYNVFCAGSGKQALEILETEAVDLLLSDIIMPEMDGYQLATIVQKQYPGVKIQLASGFSDDLHITMVDDALHQSLLHKPYNSRTLFERIRELLDR